MSESLYFHKLVYEAMFKGYPLSLGTAYVGLAVGNFAVAQDSTISGEVTTVDYRRQPVQWDDFINFTMSSSIVVAWDVTTVWPQVENIFLSDSSQGGLALLYSGITQRTFRPGDRALIDIGNLRLT